MKMHHAQTVSTFNLPEIMKTLVDRQFLTLPIEHLEAEPNFNHRRYWDQESLNRLAEDIQRVGITQPLVVRPRPDQSGFWLIAGERRLRAAHQLGLATVPVVVRLVSDAEAYAVSVSENLQRDDISPAEESVIAHRAIGLANGDREEAARVLGWSRKKLDGRMLLLYCAKPVLTAVAERKIALGHAELLAGLPKAMQEQTLPDLIERGISVSQLKESIGRYAYRLEAAVFDTGDCVDCINNSERTADLFGASLGSGHCLNRECFDAKTTAWLEAKKKEAMEEYPVIFFDTEKPTDQRRFLVRDGQNGVGREQYGACQSCRDFGAVMLTEKGREGELEYGLCFDLNCHDEKRQAHRELLQAESGNDDAQTPSPTASSQAKKPAKRKSGVSALSGKLSDYREQLHFRAASSEVPNDPLLIKVLSLSSLMREVGGTPDAATELVKQHGLKGSQREKTLKKLLALDEGVLDALLSAYASALVAKGDYSKEHLKMAQEVLRHHDEPLDRYFTMSAEYLDMLTVAAIRALLEEAGFDQWLVKEKGEKGYADFLKAHKKKADLVKGVMEAGFDWNGFVPKLMRI